jgi:hypothetical protein
MGLSTTPVRAAKRRRSQRGNGLVFALLGLLVSAIGAAGIIQGNHLQARHDAGNGEATILDGLRNAANGLVFDAITQIQAGSAVARNGVTVTPAQVDGELVWQPSIAQLVGMGYLPPGWTATTSTLNDAPYEISFRRSPAACVGSACGVEGHVLLAGPIRRGAADSDGALIGPILTRIGADSGVSLPTSPAQITGFGNTWTLSNPVAGQPAGVVAVRVGSASSAYGQFVRIGDSRDPNLAGNLTVAGNTSFGNGSTLSEFKSALQVDGQVVTLQDGAGTACIVLRPDGVIDILCNGTLNATTGVFRDASGQVSRIDGAGVATDGSVSATQGFATGTIALFAKADPGAIVVSAGDLFVRNAAGDALLRVAANGDVTAGKDVVAAGALQGLGLTLTGSVSEGDACSSGQVALLAGGGLATCQGSRYRSTSRYASLGDACATPGQQATDTASSDSLICRGGYYASLSGLTSSRVYMAGFSVRHGDVVSAATALPNGCPATASPTSPQATIFLLPQTDADTPGNMVLNRDATWNGSGWTISLTDGTGAATASLAVAEVYCLYP